MPLASAERRERERKALGGWRFWGISFLPSSGARAEVNAERESEEIVFMSWFLDGKFPSNLLKAEYNTCLSSCSFFSS